METRKITIVSSRTQKKSVIMSYATTLRELKKDLKLNNIDYNNMTFYEGISKTELKADDAILPSNIPYKGVVTNELVFRLTTKEKKIKSGISDRRTLAYDGIRRYNLQESIQKRFGINFTRCKTELLEEVIAEAEKSSTTTSSKSTKDVEPKAESKIKDLKPVEVVDNAARAAISKLLYILSDKGCYDGEPIIESDDVTVVLDILGGAVEDSSQDCKSSLTSSYTDDDIDDMFKDMI